MRRADRVLIRKLLTVKGEAIWWELNGEPVVPILTQRPAHQGIGRGGSLGESTKDLERLTAWIVRNIERLIEQLEFHKVDTGRLVLSLEYKHGFEGEGWMSKSALQEPTADFMSITTTVLGLLDEREKPHVYMLTQEASHYYQIMTRNGRMPVFISEQI